MMMMAESHMMTLPVSILTLSESGGNNETPVVMTVGWMCSPVENLLLSFLLAPTGSCDAEAESLVCCSAPSFMWRRE